MTTTEKLQRIRAKCVDLRRTATGAFKAALDSTIEVIDNINELESASLSFGHHRHALVKPILAAWPEELL